LKARGDSLPELFSAAFSGMAEILKNGACALLGPDCENCDIEREIVLSAPGPEILLVDFLSEVLTASYEEEAVFCSVKFSKLNETEIVAKIFGKRFGGFDEDIKAVTYHQVQISETKNGLEAVILFDI